MNDNAKTPLNILNIIKNIDLVNVN